MKLASATLRKELKQLLQIMDRFNFFLLKFSKYLNNCKKYYLGSIQGKKKYISRKYTNSENNNYFTYDKSISRS